MSQFHTVKQWGFQEKKKKEQISKYHEAEATEVMKYNKK